jgi:ATP-dependent helicase/nuclease subunit A
VPHDLHAPDATIYAFRRNIVVAASAGTGKTHRLTALYLLLTLGLTSMGQADDRTAAEPIGPDKIVATTFSRAAAAEIEARVERALRDIVAWDGSAELGFERPIRERAERLGREVEVAELKRRAADALSRWPSAKIDTLHGVARRVVQRNALALGLAPGARVLDEEEAQAISDLAVDEALSGALSAGGARAEAARGLIVTAGGVGATRQRVRRLLDRLDEEGLAPKDLALADHLAEGRAAADALREVARRLVALGSPTFRDAAAALAAELAAPREGEVLLTDRAADHVAELFSRRMPARSKRLPADDELDDLIASLSGKTKSDRAASLVAMLRSAPTLRAREAEIVALLEDARDRNDAQKRRAGALGFGDLLRLARDALRDRPDVARSAREDIAVMLVDEFQDTSRVQRDLVYLLREREDAAAARAAGEAPSASGLSPHGLFLVGDRKQSIYGFRGADVAVFSRIAAELAGRPAGEALSLPESAWSGVDPIADFVALRESRRSGEAILAFVNAFSERDFASDRPHDAAPRGFEITYGPAEHLVAVPEAPPSRVVLVQDDGSSPEDAPPIVREASGAAREAHVAAAFVADVTRPEGDLSLAPKLSDVAILARRRSTIPLVEIALARLEIPYVVAGRALYDAPEVRDMAALLRLVLDPRDRLSLATVLRGPMVALSDTALADLSPPGRGLSVPLLGRWPVARPVPEPEGQPIEMVDPSRLTPAERGRLEHFRSRYAEIRRAALRLPPGEAIRAAMTAFDLDRVLAALPRAEARIGNLDRLVTIARRRGGTLAAFVRWLERRIKDDADEAEAAVFSPEDDAVRLTTIHASKGLDFPVVVLVDLNAEPRADHGSLGFVSLDGDASAPTLVVRHYARRGEDRALTALVTSTLRASQADARAREQAERRRLTYVAATRARGTLALIGSASAPRPGSALRSIAAGLEEGDLTDALSEIVPASDLLASARPAPPRAPTYASSDLASRPRPPKPTTREIAMDAGALALFRDCPRRFRLRHLLGLEEPESPRQLDLFAVSDKPDPIVDLPPPVAADPAEMALPLHRAPHVTIARWPIEAWGRPTDPAVIAARLAALGLPRRDAETERLADAIARFLEGPYARASVGARIRSNERFAIEIALGARPPRALLLSGTIDLVVDRGDRVDAIEIRGGRPRAAHAAHAFGIRAAALSIARARPAAEVRCGVLSLGGPPEPAFLRGASPEGSLDAGDVARFEKDLAMIASRFAEARFEDRWDSVPPSTCRRVGCGFVTACHGAAAGDDAAP